MPRLVHIKYLRRCEAARRPFGACSCNAAAGINMRFELTLIVLLSSLENGIRWPTALAARSRRRPKEKVRLWRNSLIWDSLERCVERTFPAR